jgi:hypothetical protein
LDVWRRKISLAPAGIRTPVLPAHSLAVYPIISRNKFDIRVAGLAVNGDK